MNGEGWVPKELAKRWGVDLRTVRRRRILLGMEPAKFTGTVPIYTEGEVERAERAWLRHIRGVLAAQSSRASRMHRRRAAGASGEARLVSTAELRDAARKAAT